MKPVLQALLLADHVYIDQTTGKKIVAGIFHTVQFKKQIPQDAAQPPKREPIFSAGSPFLYISLTEMRGPTAIEINFVDLLDNTILMSNKVQFSPPPEVTPLTTVEFVMPLPFLQIGKAGNYAIELHCDGDLIGSHRIAAVEITENQQ